ncbi:hypothetical protein HHI36_015306 [Cryptolaemus montrouzieri]|uniref:Cytochrome P450 n=1 Tax=Cryptolaemus montrouzieri TaxID=559131 RepID=A0ABD2N5B5_9CUCU
MLGVLLLVFLLMILYIWIMEQHRYWVRKNMISRKVVPIFGDFFLVLLGKESFNDLLFRIYKKFHYARYIGGYRLLTPILVVRSPEIIKQISVKEFGSFMDHMRLFPENKGDLFSKNLSQLKGQNWRNMRSILSPVFTSSKMKGMFVLINHNSQSFVQHFLDRDHHTIEVQFKDTFRRYCSDVIANTVFGLDINSLNDRGNEFYVMAKNASNFSSFRRKFVFFLYYLSPFISKMFRISFTSGEEQSFFVNFVKDTISLREDNNIKRQDILGFLLQMRKQHNEINDESEITKSQKSQRIESDLTEMDITALLFSFYLAGVDSTSDGMCFLAHELALNPEIQKKLIEEIDRNRSDSVVVSHETISKMPYLDMVISELHRKWPINVATDRVVTKPYTIQPELPNEKALHLDIGTNIVIPIYPIHHDPKYYEEPDKFDPERFAPENKKNIHPFTYMPFGIGPRHCIASRFVVLVMKSVFFYLLSHFEIVTVEKTKKLLKMNKKSLSLTSEGNFDLGLKKRR